MNKPPDAGMLCLDVLMDGRCEKGAACPYNHDKDFTEKFKGSKSDQALKRLMKFNKNTIQDFRNRKYAIIKNGTPTGPPKCMNCGKTDHRSNDCPDPKQTCTGCKEDHATWLCFEAKAWSMIPTQIKKEDFR